MKTDILLINPYIHDFTAYDLWVKPLGLYWLAAYLEQYGYRPTVIDCLDRFCRPWLQQQGRKRPKGSRYGYGPFPYTIIAKPEIYAPVPRHYRRFGNAQRRASAEPHSHWVREGCQRAAWPDRP